MKIFDIVFFYNEHQLLDQRVKYLEKTVSKTIVLNFGGDHIQNESVVVIPILENFDEFKKKKFIKMIFNFIGNKKISYEDKFIFSKTFEIPSIKVINEFLNLKDQGPIILNQETLIHSINQSSLYKNVGCSLSSYGDLLMDQSMESRLFKNILSFFDKEGFLNGGYCLLNFDKNYQSLKSLKYWFPELTENLNLESLKYLRSTNKNIFDNEKPHALINVANEDLKLFDFSDDTPTRIKKIYVTFFYEKDIPNIYDEVVYVTENNLEIDGITTWFVKKPHKVHYKSKNYFEDYKKNDLLTCLRSLNLNDEDEIYIKTKTIGNPMVFKYNILRNSIPSEII